MTAAEVHVPTPPFTLTCNPDGIPDELKSLAQFLCWDWEFRDDRWTKPPINPFRAGYASSTDPMTHAPLDIAVKAYQRRNLAGIGFAVYEDDPFFFADLDHCRNPATGEITPWAQRILSRFRTTYQEVSPSGTGMRIIGRGRMTGSQHTKQIAGAEKGAKVEIFDSGKYTTLTGHRFGDAMDIADCQELLESLELELWPPKQAQQSTPHHQSHGASSDDDDRILEKARNGSKGAEFSALFDRGDISGHNNDRSSADQGLCNRLAFWFGPDRTRIDRAFRRSALMRAKWDEKHHGDGRTYGAGTIDKALDGREDFYILPRPLRVVTSGRSGTPPPPNDDPPGNAADDAHEPDAPSQRPMIDAGNQNLEVVSAQAWRALQRSNDPPRLFRFGGVPVRIEGDDDDAVPVAQTLSEDRLGHELARCAEWFKVDERGNGKPAAPPPRVIKDMLAAPSYPLPALLSIVQAPVFAPDGSLQTEPGYHEAGRSFYAPAHGFTVPTVPESPTDEEVEQAKSLILDDLLGEFPFISEAERANTLALFLDPYIRNLIDGPTPLRLIEAPTPGSGKGLLADVILRAAIGSRVVLMAAPSDDDEWRKRITAQLTQLPAAILIDNLSSALDSGSLAGALTTTWWSDRRLGVNEMIRVPVRCLWVATANNPTLNTEIARRTVRIRLDPKVDRPWQRIGFRHEDLRGWADEHRPEIVCAALTLVQSWVSAGQPLGKTRLGSFEKWAAVHSGILDHLGIKGFLANANEFYEAADVEGAIWRQFVDLWFERFNETEVGVADLFTLAQGVEGFDFGSGSERAQKTSFGMALGRQRDRVIGDCRIVQSRLVKRVKRWRLVKGRPGGNPFHEPGVGNEEGG